MKLLEILIPFTPVITALGCLLIYMYMLRKRYNEATHWLHKSREYVRLFEPHPQFYIINFEEEFAVHAIAPIKTVMVFLESFTRSKKIKSTTLDFLKLIRFDETFNRIILFNLKPVNNAADFGKFHSIITGEIIADDDFKSIMTELLYPETVEVIKNWKPAV
jgi:hypothetical protein